MARGAVLRYMGVSKKLGVLYYKGTLLLGSISGVSYFRKCAHLKLTLEDTAPCVAVAG